MMSIYSQGCQHISQHAMDEHEAAWLAVRGLEMIFAFGGLAGRFWLASFFFVYFYSEHCKFSSA